MTAPLDLDAVIACPWCGGQLTEHVDTTEPPDLYHYTCAGCGYEAGDLDTRLTWRHHPGSAPLVAEIERLRSAR